MPFPTNNISATSIRQELASSNSDGIQTNVALNDTAVRAAANRPSGNVSFADLSGVNILFSGLLTLNTRFVTPSPNNFLRYYGYFPNFAPQFGGRIGSVNTASYYRLAPNFNDGTNTAPLISFGYNGSSNSSGFTNRTSINFQTFSSFPVNNISINFGTTRVTVVPNFNVQGGWEFIGDPFDFQNRAPSSPIQIVITYT